MKSIQGHALLKMPSFRSRLVERKKCMPKITNLKLLNWNVRSILSLSFHLQIISSLDFVVISIHKYENNSCGWHLSKVFYSNASIWNANWEKNSNHFFKIYSKLYIVNRLLDCSSQNRFFQCAPTELCGCKAPEKWDRKRVKWKHTNSSARIQIIIIR